MLGQRNGEVMHYHIIAYNKKKDERLAFVKIYWHWDKVAQRFLDITPLEGYRHWVEACEDVDCLVQEMAR